MRTHRFPPLPARRGKGSCDQCALAGTGLPSMTGDAADTSEAAEGSRTRAVTRPEASRSGPGGGTVPPAAGPMLCRLGPPVRACNSGLNTRPGPEAMRESSRLGGPTSLVSCHTATVGRSAGELVAARSSMVSSYCRPTSPGRALSGEDAPMDSTVTVRPARREDAAAMAKMHMSSWQETYRGVMTDRVLDDPGLVDVRERFWTTALVDERHRAKRIAVAERDGAVIGVAMAGPPESSVSEWSQQLYVLYVLAAEHGTGVGAALLDAVVHPEESVVLWVAEPNPRAQAFYRKHGFSPDGTQQMEGVCGKSAWSGSLVIPPGDPCAEALRVDSAAGPVHLYQEAWVLRRCGCETDRRPVQRGRRPRRGGHDRRMSRVAWCLCSAASRAGSRVRRADDRRTVTVVEIFTSQKECTRRAAAAVSIPGSFCPRNRARPGSGAAVMRLNSCPWASGAASTAEWRAASGIDSACRSPPWRGVPRRVPGRCLAGGADRVQPVGLGSVAVPGPRGSVDLDTSSLPPSRWRVSPVACPPESSVAQVRSRSCSSAKATGWAQSSAMASTVISPRAPPVPVSTAAE